MHFNYLRKSVFLVLGIAVLIVFSNSSGLAQKKSKGEYITAAAMGTSYQLGRLVNVEIRINEYSTDEERSALIEAFAEKGSAGLANALNKMKAKGRIAITGTLGFDVNFVRVFNMPDGSRKIRFVTDRPVTFAESWASTRSVDYEITIGEINISKQKGKSKGTLFPVAKLKLNKDNEIEIEALQNPWDLTNIRSSMK